MPRLVCQTPPNDLTDSEIAAVDKFWHNFAAAYEEIRIAIFMHNQAEQMLYSINSSLDKLGSFIEICLTFGEKNRLAIEPYTECLELYISPKLSPTALHYMEAVYHRAPNLPGLSIAKFRPYNIQDPIVRDISYGLFAISSDDLRFQCIRGYRPSDAFCDSRTTIPQEKIVQYPVMHIIVHVARHCVAWLLEETNVRVVGQKYDLISSMTGVPGADVDHERRVLTEKKEYSGCIFSFLLSALGEYNVVHHVGYIEIVAQPVDGDNDVQPVDGDNDAQPVDGDNDVHLLDIYQLKDEMTTLLKLYDYRTCGYCGVHELQQRLYRCSKCHAVYYCSRTCQVAQRPTHRIICHRPNSHKPCAIEQPVDDK